MPKDHTPKIIRGALAPKIAELGGEAVRDFDRIYRENALYVLGLLRRFGVGRAQAEDLTHDVFEAMFYELAQLPANDRASLAQMRAYLFRLTWNRVANHRRLHTVRNERPTGNAPDRGVGPRAHDYVLARELARFLDALDPMATAIFVGFEVFGATIPELAAEHYMTEKEARTVLHHARYMLRRNIGAKTAESNATSAVGSGTPSAVVDTTIAAEPQRPPQGSTPQEVVTSADADLIRRVHEEALQLAGGSPLCLNDLPRLAAVLGGADDATTAAATLRATVSLMGRCHLPEGPSLRGLDLEVRCVARCALIGEGPTNHPDPAAEDPFVLNEARVLTSDPTVGVPLTVEQGGLLVDAIVAAVALGSPDAVPVAQELLARRASSLLKRLWRQIDAFWKTAEANGVDDDRRRAIVTDILALRAPSEKQNGSVVEGR